MLRPQLREGQEQGELFTTASEYNPAQEKEAQNKDDQTIKKVKQNKHEEQRAAAAGAAGAGVTSDDALKMTKLTYLMKKSENEKRPMQKRRQQQISI